MSDDRWPWAESQVAFAAAAGWFLETAAEVGDRWDERGLGEWDVRSLVGHTSRSFVTVETYLGQPADEVEIGSAVDYYRATRELARGPGVAERGREAGAALGDDPVTALGVLARRVVPLVEGCTGDELLTSIVGGMRLADYLPTRVFELVVHTCDLAAALGRVPEPPAAAARQALAITAALAVDDGAGGRLLLALTGRDRLPAGWSVL